MLLGTVSFVLVAQAGTVYAVHRMISTQPAPPPAAVEPSRGSSRGSFAQRYPGATGEMRRAAPARDVAEGDATGQPPALKPMRAHAAPRARWSERPLDDASRKLADDLGRSPDELRLLADTHGRVTDAAQRDLLAGRDTAKQLAQKLGINADREDEMTSIMLGFMLRRVTMRESFRGTSVTPQAIDAAARGDALAATQHNFDDGVRDAVASALPGLPDLTSDLPP